MEVRTETKTVEVTETFFVSKDGRKFKTDTDCKAWEAYLEEHKVVCPCCHGKGRFYRGQKKVFVEPEFRDLDDGMRSVYETCSLCEGKGWILPAGTSQQFGWSAACGGSVFFYFLLQLKLINRSYIIYFKFLVV